MPDPIFEDKRLAEIYDYFDGHRDDLFHYLQIAYEFNASTILDIGSGTGCFACLLASEGFNTIGLEPAEASLEVAKTKQHADKVQWILGDAMSLHETRIDMAFMTGNVAQVFLSDKEWKENLIAIHHALTPEGHLVFETRVPEKQAWQNWTREKTYQKQNLPKIGTVEAWCDLQNVSGEYVTFLWTYHFHADNKTITSESTIRFRQREDITLSLQKAGYTIIDIRDAPDRPSQEFVFIVKKAQY